MKRRSPTLVAVYAFPLAASIFAPAILACNKSAAGADGGATEATTATAAADTATASATATDAPAPTAPLATVPPATHVAVVHATTDAGAVTTGDGGATPLTPLTVPSGLASALRGIPTTLPPNFRLPPGVIPPAPSAKK